MSELFGDADTRGVGEPNAILYGMAALIPAMAAAGGSGFSLGKAVEEPLVRRKALRMKLAATNGVLVLVPSAIFYGAASVARAVFDGAFVAVQALRTALPGRLHHPAVAQHA